MGSERIPVVIINGFLGSGKTTLLRSLLGQSYRNGLSVGVVVNEMSDLDVDGDLVAETDLFERDDYFLRSIHNCVLSSRHGLSELDGALRAILSEGCPDLIIIETSGSCHPLPLVEFFRNHKQFHLTGVLVLVDSAMMEQDYESGCALIPLLQANMERGQRGTVNLLVEQILLCSHLLVTKADRIGSGKLQDIGAAIHGVNPLVSVVSVPWGRLDLDEVLNLPAYDYDRVETVIGEVRPLLRGNDGGDRPYNLVTRVITDDRPFHPQRLWDVFHHRLGQAIYRSKGIFYLASRDRLSLLWNQAAGSISLELMGYWRSGVLEDDQSILDAEEIAGLRRLAARNAGRFGDRHCHLTIIGDATQIDLFTAQVEQCFLDDAEIGQWQAGGTFEDPWPDRFAKLKH
jgi:G3E family GTPase